MIVAMPDEPRKRHFSVQIPPARGHLPSEGPPPEGWYQLIFEELKQSREESKKQSREINARLDQHDEDIRELRESVTVGREVRQELREQRSTLHKLSEDIGTVIQSDSRQNVDLAKVKAQLSAEMAERTDVVAKKTSRRWGWPALAMAILSLATTLAKSCGPAIVNLLNK